MTHRFTLRAANAGDVEAITGCVRQAYAPYVERIGKPPGPMLDDYAAVVAAGHATVATHDGVVAGVLVMIPTDEGLLLDNVAVIPAYQGTGCGRCLLEFAEASAVERGYDSIYLYTHERMTENLILYPRIGYQEYARRTVNGYDRVYMRKPLA